MTHETTDEQGAAILSTAVHVHVGTLPFGHILANIWQAGGRALATAGEPLWLKKADEDFLDGGAVLLKGQVVGIMTEGLLDLEGDLLEVEEEEGDATDGWGGTPAVGAYHRQRQRAQPEQQEETEGGDVAERHRRRLDSLACRRRRSECVQLLTEPEVGRRCQYVLFTAKAPPYGDGEGSDDPVVWAWRRGEGV